ncbi:hypothetical protein [Thiofilum flexile]|uniref:hypothetical protein n=1 Tax=Thiofilum flexile TaxID=125627 RepID=UPI00038069D7|nr:hypothetical protein [Thiofilum flexile]
MKEVASLRYGVIFKKAFSPVDTFKAFVRDILGIELQIDKVETEKSFDKPIGPVDVRFDLFAEDKINRVIVDIQHRRYSDHYDRFLHYHCAALLEQVTSSKNYHPDLKVYTIVVLTGTDKHQEDVLEIDFDPKNRRGKGVGEIPHKILYLCPKYVNAETPEPWREWMLAIEDSLDGKIEEGNYLRPDIQKIISTIKVDGITPAEYARMKDEYSEEELRAKEREEAEERALLEGLEKGEQIGLEKGKLLEKKETALRLLAKGMSAELVADAVDLPLEVVQALT